MGYSVSEALSFRKPEKGMKSLLLSILFSGAISLFGQTIAISEDIPIEVNVVDNYLFTSDKFWRGADGAASIDLENGNILWLFSDTFIDRKGTGKRSNSNMINNSIAIQEGNAMDQGKISFYYKGKRGKPKSFFELPGKTWFWTGHGTLVQNKLVLFLFEEKHTHTGIGFEAIGWYVAIIDNPFENPLKWKIRYIKGSDTFGVIVGSSAVLKDEEFIYAYGVKEPSSHEVYLFRLSLEKLIDDHVTDTWWWDGGKWSAINDNLLSSSPLFIGQTEFSVHYQEALKQYVQIQTFGYGAATIGYRLADKPEGPWSQPIIFYQTQPLSKDEFVYSANAHPEIKSNGILVSYNVNSGDFNELISNENIYFPRLLTVKISK